MLKSFFSALADLATNARKLANTFGEMNDLLRGQLHLDAAAMPALPEPEAEAEPARKRKAS